METKEKEENRWRFLKWHLREWTAEWAHSTTIFPEGGVCGWERNLLFVLAMLTLNYSRSLSRIPKNNWLEGPEIQKTLENKIWKSSTCRWLNPCDRVSSPQNRCSGSRAEERTECSGREEEHHNEPESSKQKTNSFLGLSDGDRRETTEKWKCVVLWGGHGWGWCGAGGAVSRGLLPQSQLPSQPLGWGLGGSLEQSHVELEAHGAGIKGWQEGSCGVSEEQRVTRRKEGYSGGCTLHCRRDTASRTCRGRWQIRSGGGQHLKAGALRLTCF